MKKKKMRRMEEIHMILSRLTDEEFWTVLGSRRIFEHFVGVGHIRNCAQCGPRSDACAKRWGDDSTKVPIETPFQKEIRKMEAEIKNNKILMDEPKRIFNLVDYVFKQTRGGHTDS